jgi:hypothetical protein
MVLRSRTRGLRKPLGGSKETCMKIIEGKFWEVECACGNRSERYFNDIYIRLNLIKDGWALENDTAICPACFAAQQGRAPDAAIASENPE